MIRLKNEKEIAGIRKSCHALADLFREVVPQVKVGMSTKDIDDLCVDFIKKIGGKPAWYREGFPGAACISVNNEVIHGIPSKKKIIEDGDIVSLDIGIDLDGYISDSTHTVMVGNVKPEYKRLVKATREALAAGIAACVVGNRIRFSLSSIIPSALFKTSAPETSVISYFSQPRNGFPLCPGI